MGLELLMSLSEKYVVRPILETNPPSDQLSEGKALPQGSYFVLRKRDVLAIHSLWSYVGVLHLACELLSDGQEKANMAILADKISDLAYEWEESDSKKLPD
jgi:hypothetical protein